jgi:hypothetical protein
LLRSFTWLHPSGSKGASANRDLLLCLLFAIETYIVSRVDLQKLQLLDCIFRPRRIDHGGILINNEESQRPTSRTLASIIMSTHQVMVLSFTQKAMRKSQRAERQTLLDCCPEGCHLAFQHDLSNRRADQLARFAYNSQQSFSF